MTDTPSSLDQKSAVNARVQARYDELRAEAKHGIYETIFRIVHEERDAARAEERARCARIAKSIRDGDHVAGKHPSHAWVNCADEIAAAIENIEESEERTAHG